MYQRIIAIFIMFFTLQAHATDPIELEVWANAAIVATDTYDYQNFMERQKEIAKYFTADAWISYSKALQAAKLIESVQQNNYSVSAVATLPPTITLVRPNHWQAVMPILVLYKNSKYQQTQSLDITLNFTAVPAGQGVRGYTITSLQAKTGAPPCKCAQAKNKATIV